MSSPPAIKDILAAQESQHLPSTIDGRPWKGHGNMPGILSRIQLRSMATTLLGYQPPSRLTKTELAKVIIALRQPGICAAQTTRPDNDICPFSQESLVEPFFVRVTSTGYRRGYSLSELAEYFVTVGKTIDPIDKEAFSHADLVEMDRQLTAAKMTKSIAMTSIMSAEQQAKYAADRLRQEEVEVMQDELEDLMPDILDTLVVLHNFCACIEATTQCYRSFYTLQQLSHRLARFSVPSLVRIMSATVQGLNSEYSQQEREFIETFLTKIAVDAIVDNNSETHEPPPLGHFIDDHDMDENAPEEVLVEMSMS